MQEMTLKARIDCRREWHDYCNEALSRANALDPKDKNGIKKLAEDIIYVSIPCWYTGAIKKSKKAELLDTIKRIMGRLVTEAKDDLDKLLAEQAEETARMEAKEKTAGWALERAKEKQAAKLLGKGECVKGCRYAAYRLEDPVQYVVVVESTNWIEYETAKFVEEKELKDYVELEAGNG